MRGYSKLDVYGIPEADQFILNEMLKRLQGQEGFNYDGECFEGKLYKAEADNIKRWQWHTNNPPTNDIYRLLGHLQEKYESVYNDALQEYCNYKQYH